MWRIQENVGKTLMAVLLNKLIDCTGILNHQESWSVFSWLVYEVCFMILNSSMTVLKIELNGQVLCYLGTA